MLRPDHSSRGVLPSVVFRSVTNSRLRPTRAVEVMKRSIILVKDNV